MCTNQGTFDITLSTLFRSSHKETWEKKGAITCSFSLMKSRAYFKNKNKNKTSMESMRLHKMDLNCLLKNHNIFIADKVLGDTSCFHQS